MADIADAGIAVCLGCDWKFVSPDPRRVRRCADCKSHEPYALTPVQLPDDAKSSDTPDRISYL